MQQRSSIIVKSYNPFEARYPGRLLVPRDTLDLIKTARAAGYTVSIRPKDGRRLEYWDEKGLGDLLTNPLFIFLAGIPVTIATGLIVNFITARSRLLNRVPASTAKPRVIIEANDEKGTFRYDHSGEPVSLQEAKEVLRTIKERQRTYAATVALRPPDPELPFAVHLEHTSRVVGWARIVLDDEARAIVARPLRITDDETWRRIQTGELRGLSVAFIARKATCSICLRAYVDCNHISAEEYDGQSCTNTVDGQDLCEVSIVKEPVNEQCLIHAERTVPADRSRASSRPARPHKHID